MKRLTLQTSNRNIMGKKTRFLRRQGLTPVHLFGHGLQSRPLQSNTAELRRIIVQAGTTRLVSLEIEGDKRPRNVFIREIQRDAITRTLLHVDLYQIRMEERIRAEVPIVLIGEAPALKEKGRILTHGITNLSVECLPDRMPPEITVDLGRLEELEQAIFVRDLALDAEVTVATDPEQLVVKISEVHVEKVEEVGVPAGVEEVAAKAEAKAPPPEEPVEKKTAAS